MDGKFLKPGLVIIALLFLTVSVKAQMANETKGTETQAMPAVNEAAPKEVMDEVQNAAMDDMTSDGDSGDEEVVPSIARATATIEGTEEGSEIYGEVELTQTTEGLSVLAEVYNAPTGKHGFHIHDNGSCADKGDAAGGHFNPDGVTHGMLTKDGHQHAHAGDMGNIDIDESGYGSLTILLPGVTLTDGKYSVKNRAIILHEKEDDFGQPTGNAGSRIGCGVITTVE